MKEVSDAVDKFENDDSIGALVITGSEKAFAAGKQPNRIVHRQIAFELSR
jgi:enoyl-CoA hydratase/carnithine racemase